MWEYVLGVLSLLSIYICAFVILRVVYLVTSDLKNNSAEIADQTQINLNHVAEAIVGLSELLEEADQVIEDISRVPTVGDILQQAVQGFIVQKLAPMLPQPLQDPAQQIITESVNGLVHGKEERPKDEKESKPEI
tara:strand:- start:650 stop:1054 length:405 start_codon:yes stop_codon:yes gene_type:complete